MLSRRLLCLRANIDRLDRRRCYLWTFTFGEAVPYEELRERWNRLLTYLRRRLPNWSGIRVYEVHPGKWGEYSHGIHVHVVCNKRHDVALIWQTAKQAGWGRVHVTVCNKGAAHYVAKYLAKARPDCLKGWRLWACFNMPARTRMADILIDTPRAKLMRLGHSSGAFTGLGWMEKQSLVAKWAWQRIAGVPLSLPFLRGQDYRQPVSRPVSFTWAQAFRSPRRGPVKWRDADLRWPFEPRQLVAVVARPEVYCAMTGWEDITLLDKHREAAYRRLVRKLSA